MTIQAKPKVIVGLSGGVDSSVTALLLKQQGYEVEGLFMKNWEEDDTAQYCSAKTDLEDVKAICKNLAIPLHTVNFSQEYWENVFSLFLEDYQNGRTPNPDILCNKEIKFNVFLEHALKLGAEKIATGHYAQITQHSPYELHQGRDPNKDQSYFLYTLNQYALSKSLFPIGHLAKPHVRKLAKEANLVTHSKKDSTGICFIGKRKFKTFLQDFVLAKPGIMQTPEGITVGEHDGLMYYTLGQRQGLKIGGLKNFETKPWYVVAKDLESNILFVTQNSQHPWHFCTQLQAEKMHWVNPPNQTSFKAQAKTRYRQQSCNCVVHLQPDNQVIVQFEQPQTAVTPGQSVVFYQGSNCLGGGMIQATNSLGGLMQANQFMNTINEVSHVD